MVHFHVLRNDTDLPETRVLTERIENLCLPMLERAKKAGIAPPENLTLRVVISDEDDAQVESQAMDRYHWIIGLQSDAVRQKQDAAAQVALAHGLAHRLLKHGTHYDHQPSFASLCFGNQAEEREAAKLAMRLHPFPDDHIRYFARHRACMEEHASYLRTIGPMALSSQCRKAGTRTHPHGMHMISLIVREAEAMDIPVSAECLAELPPPLCGMIRQREGAGVSR
jgi:hypothetical protein